MINFKKNTKEHTGSKSRSRSIYNGDQTHTLSMNIKIDHDFSPETFRQPKDPKQAQHKALKHTYK